MMLSSQGSWKWSDNAAVEGSAAIEGNAGDFESRWPTSGAHWSSLVGNRKSCGLEGGFGFGGRKSEPTGIVLVQSSNLLITVATLLHLALRWA